MAAEDTEASLKGLPNAKTTRYIEMGKSEMEVSERCWEALIDDVFEFFGPPSTSLNMCSSLLGRRHVSMSLTKLDKP